MDSERHFKKIPILTLKHDVLLPGESKRIDIKSDSEKSLLNILLADSSSLIGIIPLKEKENGSLVENQIGTIGLLIRASSSHIPHFSYFISVLGIQRFSVKKIFTNDNVQYAEGEVQRDDCDNLSQDTINILDNLKKIVIPLFQKIGLAHVSILPTFKAIIDKLPSTIYIDVCLSALPSSFEDKLDVLNSLNLTDRIAKLIPLTMKYLGFDPNSDENKKIIDKSVPQGVTIFRILKSSSQLKDNDNEDRELVDLQRKLQNSNLPDYALKSVTRDLNRLKRMTHFSPDHSVLRNYLEFVAELPWSILSEETLDISAAREKLDQEHYGMEKLKKRVLEYLAVRQLNSKITGPILCFIGPPGVGKTSIGRSIAQILNKKFQRISLGGVSNQSEIRGHRRTYVGALPGRILEAIKNAGTKNPVILLDEIDKLQRGIHGDPQAALLEVLDPEQNSNFTDHYLGMPFDLSQVTFIATANSARTIPLPLYDRMEVISVSGYTYEEKFQIAVRHLLPKQLDRHGLNNELQFTDEALNKTIVEYTKEAGVRGLERKIAAVCRAIALKVADMSYDSLPIVIDDVLIEEILGSPPYIDIEESSRPLKPGVGIGLAWSPIGGSILTVEVTRLPGGKGTFTLTGCIGNVMKESARIAFNWVRSIAPQYGIYKESCDAGSDLHIHFPSGAVNKEGPSAGITIACAILSLFTGVPIASGLAMTGEITLQGIVLPVGGIREKLTAAHRKGFRKVIMPFKSKKDLANVSDHVFDNLEVILVENMAEVIDAAFEGSLSALPNESLLCSKL